MSPSRPPPLPRRAQDPHDPKAPAAPRHARPKHLLSPLPRPVDLAERIERAASIDRVTAPLARRARRALRRTPAADVLHGVPFGQPAHPPIVTLPIGCWVSATLLDLLPGGAGQAPSALIAAGIAGAAPAAATGVADWSALHREQQRVGLVHAASGATATALQVASLIARMAGRRKGGKLLSFGGLTVAAAGGYLGGHLAFRLGAGASHAQPVAHLTSLGWHDLCRVRDLPGGRPVRRQLGYLDLLVLRQGTQIYALADQCAHLGGPLHQGRVVAEGDDVCVACPWHGSTFRVTDGAVIHGPATARQPAFDTRITASGMVQVKPRG